MKNFRPSKTTAFTSVLMLATFVSGGQAQVSCQNVGGHLDGQIIGPNAACNGALTEIGTFTGNLSGTFVACITNLETRGDGVLVFNLNHTYKTTHGDTYTATDHVVAAPVGPPVYRINNRADVTGGTGVLQDAFGFTRDHGTVDLANGVISVDFKGRICTP